jgi:hypothetical protein
MPIPDRRITNLASFREVTENPRQIAGLYFYQLLDSLVRLQLYTNLGHRPSDLFLQRSMPSTGRMWSSCRRLSETRFMLHFLEP